MDWRPSSGRRNGHGPSLPSISSTSRWRQVLIDGFRGLFDRRAAGRRDDDTQRVGASARLPGTYFSPVATIVTKPGTPASAASGSQAATEAGPSITGAPSANAPPSADNVGRSIGGNDFPGNAGLPRKQASAPREPDIALETGIDDISHPPVGHNGQASAPDGRLRLTPWAAPSRDFLLLAPARQRTGKRLLVLVHGCRQAPPGFAAATGASRLVERGDWLVLLPAQSRSASHEGCWNWFDPRTAAGGGESAIVLAAVEQVAQRYEIDADATCIAGMSSGAALAAAIVANAPHRFAAAAFHSGIAMGASSSPLRSRRVMQRGPDRDVTVGLSAQSRLPVMVIHGLADQQVSPRHADELMRQMLTINGRLSPGAALPEPDGIETSDQAHRTTQVRRFGLHRQVMIEGLGHAWSGGSPDWTFNDPSGPDALTMIANFFSRHTHVASSAPTAYA